VCTLKTTVFTTSAPHRGNYANGDDAECSSNSGFEESYASHGAHQRLIREALSEHREIELLDLPRVISVEGSRKPQEAIRAGHERARALLRQSHADVMIWGSALDSDIKAPLILHWTMSTEVAQRKSQGKYRPDDAHDLDLPELFWADMNDVLGMLVTVEEAKVSTQEGHAIADQLKPFIERIHYLLQSRKLARRRRRRCGPPSATPWSSTASS
jgi:hypothetical protein